MKKQFENDMFILYSPDSLDYITSKMEQILYKSINLYKRIFKIKVFRKVQINYFDNLDDFRNYIYELRGERKSLPKYAKATFDRGMINAYIEPNIIEGSSLYQKRLYNASHELFHIMYQELVWEKNNIPRIVWFDEGMAQLFSGEFEKELEDFDKYVNNVLSNTKTIPKLNELVHGVDFETNSYSGYKLSLIAVKYIFDKIGIDEFNKLLYDEKTIYKYGDNVLEEVMSKY